jgi:hypothetical protein
MQHSNGGIMRHSMAALSRATSAVLAGLLLATGLAGCVSFDSGSAAKGASRAPVAWGISRGAKSCVIFREYTKTTLGFAVVVAGMSTHGELEVVESGSYTLPKPVWVQDQDSMNELQRLSEQGLVRYVKIQDKYTPAELEAGRDLCRRGMAS